MLPDKHRYSRQELARASGTTLKALRCYEAAGLLDGRAAGERRGYDDDSFKRLRLVLALRDLGWSTRKIKSLLSDTRRDQLASHLAQAVRDATAQIERFGRVRSDLIAARESMFECARCERPDESCSECVETGKIGPIAGTLLVRRKKAAVGV